MEIASLAALALGFIYVGSGDGEITGTILQTLMERDHKQLDEKWARFMSLGLALLYIGSLTYLLCHTVTHIAVMILQVTKTEPTRSSPRSRL